MKKIIFVFMLTISTLATACSSVSFLEISPEAITVLSSNNIEACGITKLAPYTGIERETTAIEITDAQVMDFANQLVANHIEKEPIQGRQTVADGDYTLFNYEVKSGNKVIDTVYGCVAHIGSGSFDKKVEEEMIGRPLGQVFQINWTVPAIPAAFGDFPELVGEDVQIQIYIREIYSLTQYELDDEFVRKFYDCQSVDEFLASIKLQLESQAQEKKIDNEKETLIKTIVSDSQFVMNKDEVSDFAAKIYFDYRASSITLGIDVLTYARNNGLGNSEEELLQTCYEDAEYKIQRLLVLDRIAYIEGLGASKEEVAQYCSDLGGDVNELTDVEYSEIKVAVSQEKVIDYLYQMSK